jgi:endonuclease-3 related protein
MSAAARTLMEIYRAMRSRYGHQHWWPGQTPLEICVGAILTQNTNWKNVEKAIANLTADGCMTVGRLHAKGQAELADLIRPAGYYNVKARRLKSFVGAVHASAGDDIEAFLDRDAASLRQELLAISGIGRETADSIILYAAKRLSFVVDAYTWRIGARHGLFLPEDDYETIKELFESSLPQDVALWNDYHAQLVAVGKNHCRPTARCDGCPLAFHPHDAEIAR